MSPALVFQQILEENMRNAITARQILLDSESGAGAHQSTINRMALLEAVQGVGASSDDDTT
jgi:hypothetical protein